jgi:selenocysteine-specific elongation factor
LVVGEIATRHMLVVINKVDLLPAELRAKLVAKAKKRLAQTLAATSFAGCPMVAVSAKPGAACTALFCFDLHLHAELLASRNPWLAGTHCGFVPQNLLLAWPHLQTCHHLESCPEASFHALRCMHAGGGEGPGRPAEGTQAVVAELLRLVVQAPARRSRIPTGRGVPQPHFLFSVDHCFALKGQGTVLTGTVLSGSIKVLVPQLSSAHPLKGFPLPLCIHLMETR